MIYTSYFANIKKLPENTIPIAVCAKLPEGYQCNHFKKLAPTYESFAKYKSDGDWESFAESYKREVLSKFKPLEIVKELQDIAGSGNNIALICYEKAGAPCHRTLIAEWLTKGGISTRELIL